MQDIKKLNLKITRLVDSLFVGNYKTAFKGRGLEFSDYRPYDENDDAKYIDFLASAREGKLLIKRFEEERELSVFFLLDLSESLNFGQEKTKIDTLIETFYILSYSAIKNNDKIGSIIFDDNGFEVIKLGKGIKTISKILEIIKQKNIKKTKNFEINNMIGFFNNLPIKNSLIFLLTDKMGEITDKNLKILSLKNDFIYINIFDYIENNLLDENGIFRLKNSIKTFFINLANKQKVLKYRELRNFKINEFKAKLNKYKIGYLLIDNKTNIFAKLLTFFKNR
ncbi:MAG: DUF58 domain-containing protein [Candidatus Gracilibacteria bacterium]|nr:DUF58 domain-containing protein [Candidatus Gracilibacteria bacterium]